MQLPVLNSYLHVLVFLSIPTMKDTKISSVKMQLRPLQQVMAKGQLPAIYAHAVSLKSMNKPRLTITSHPADDGEMIWYLGGNLAETGAGKSAEEVIRQAQKEIGELLPWIDISQVAWASFNIDRAEPAQASMTRPDSPFVEAKDNCIVCWPTKLTLAPMLGDIVLNELNLEANAIPGTTPDLRPAPYAQTPWEIAFAG